jgi:hypothetical protein
MRAWIVVSLVCLAGCYSSRRAAPDINAAWQGRSEDEIKSRWGQPAAITDEADGTVMTWSHTRSGVRLPSAAAGIDIGPGHAQGYASYRPGEVWSHSTEVYAHLDRNGVIRAVEGPSGRWGPPNDANIHWGFLFGGHVGMGRLDDTGTMLPSGGLYMGGMLSRTTGLVGTYSMVSGKDDAGGAMGFAWGMAVQWWLDTPFWVRVGPAMILAFDPGFEDAGLEAGVTAGASYAVVKVGTFALDLRLDLAAGSNTAFGSVGIGVNIN